MAKWLLLWGIIPRLLTRVYNGSLDFTAKAFAILFIVSFRPAEKKVVKVTDLSSASDVCIICYIHVCNYV